MENDLKEKRKIGQTHFASANFSGSGAFKVDLDTVTAASTSANSSFDAIVDRLNKRIEELLAAKQPPEEDESNPGS
jgi:hypothetical protein